MSEPTGGEARNLLQTIAHRVMIERGLAPDFSPAALKELKAITSAPAAKEETAERDLRELPWCSIDNDDSRDLDQLSVAEALPDGSTKILVAIADVSALVVQGSAIDDHARQNTTSVYTAARIFPMLPEPLSTDLTSLGFGAARQAIVIEMVFSKDGALKTSDIYSARVRNQAKLAYNSVAAWLEATGPIPAAITAVKSLDENIRMQDRVAQQLREIRHLAGALSLETIEARPVFTGATLTDIHAEKTNRAKQLIEDFMIASNGVTARFLAAKSFPSIRRVVRTPKYWDRIVELATQHGGTLPEDPDAIALEKFLLEAQKKDPTRFPDLSLSVIKLMGAGEYVLELPGANVTGHFGLAVKDYAHSTAPNRRFPDVITQRLVKAAMAGRTPPYANDVLQGLAMHCTQQEDAAKKVERQVGKSAAALLLQSRIGEQFDAIVTGASEKGTWVRLNRPPVEGKLVAGAAAKQVGDRVRVTLAHTNVERGFIDFTTSG